MQYRRNRSRNGFTLLEVMIATAVTLLMMISLTQIFKIIGDSMQKGRSALELNNRLRNVSLRIQEDLGNVTAIMRPPADAAKAQGYFKYYDGPFTDYSAAAYSSSISVADQSRFGDTDDVLMFTARADDVWYTGKVPLFVLQGVPPNATNTEPVSIASQYAEIVLFAEPVVTAVDNPGRDPLPLLADPNLYAVLPGTDMPAQYRLHYRTLLIRPDLNVGGFLPNNLAAGGDWMVAQTRQVLVGGTFVDLPSPTCDMTSAHVQCDLSIRRVDPFSAVSAIAANSLEDLSDPANRFAHVRIPLQTGTTTMPVLALSPKVDMPYTAASAGSTTLNNPPNPLEYQSGFLHPAFTLTGARAGEDILASDVLAFDVKGFDPGAAILATLGADGVPGSAGDDDANGVVDDASELGWAGSDDQVLEPSDYGYGLAAGSATVGVGAYVDLAWDHKFRAHGLRFPAPPANRGRWGELAVFGASSFFTDSFYRSGLALQVGSGVPIIFQPSYDTWTSRYESDGLFQGETAVPSGRRGVVAIVPSATTPTFLDPWGRGVVDAGTDGIDNNAVFSLGIDDLSEQETSPPFPTELRGIKVTLRIEDPNTRQFDQMSISEEFVTTQ